MDVVYTFVDDQDPVWRAERAQYSPDPTINNPHAHSINRFRTRDELRYSIRSVAHYFQDLRRLIVVVSSPSQVPSWLRTDRVVIVTHDQLGIPTPCYNSHAIEANLHHIPNLSEPFLYLNDDFFFHAPLSRRDFVRADGKILIPVTNQRSWYGSTSVNENPHVSAVKNSTNWIDQHYGVKPRRRIQHSPVVISPSIMRELWERLPEELTTTTHARFRSVDDYAITCSLHQHYTLETGRAVNSPLTGINLQSAKTKTQARIWLIGKAFYCLNDGPEDTDFYPELQQELNPHPSPFERTSTTFVKFSPSKCHPFESRKRISFGTY